MPTETTLTPTLGTVQEMSARALDILTAACLAVTEAGLRLIWGAWSVQNAETYGVCPLSAVLWTRTGNVPKRDAFEALLSALRDDGALPDALAHSFYGAYDRRLERGDAEVSLTRLAIQRELQTALIALSVSSGPDSWQYASAQAAIQRAAGRQLALDFADWLATQPLLQPMRAAVLANELHATGHNAHVY